MIVGSLGLVSVQIGAGREEKPAVWTRPDVDAGHRSSELAVRSFPRTVEEGRLVPVEFFPVLAGRNKRAFVFSSSRADFVWSSEGGLHGQYAKDTDFCDAATLFGVVGGPSWSGRTEWGPWWRTPDPIDKENRSATCNDSIAPGFGDPSRRFWEGGETIGWVFAHRRTTVSFFHCGAV